MTQDVLVRTSVETIVRFQPKGSVKPESAPASAVAVVAVQASRNDAADEVIREIGGRKDGTDPTRFGDWEKNGRCIDF